MKPAPYLLSAGQTLRNGDQASPLLPLVGERALGHCKPIRYSLNHAIDIFCSTVRNYYLVEYMPCRSHVEVDVLKEKENLTGLIALPTTSILQINVS